MNKYLKNNKKQILTVAALLIASVATGYVLTNTYLTSPDQDNRTQLYSNNDVYEVNQTHETKQINFHNQTIGVWFDSEQERIYLDLTGDGDYATERENLQKDGEVQRFVQNIARGQKAYQIYFEYQLGSENPEDNFVRVYSIQEI